MRRTAALLVVAVWGIVAIVGSALPLADVRLRDALRAPGPAAWCGSDALGRPLCALLAQGATTAAVIGIASVAAALAIGVAFGVTAAVRGGWTDAAMARSIDVVLAFPGVLLALALAAMFGPGFAQTWLALTLLGWPAFARVARAEALHLRGEAYVEAARVAGARPARLLWRHIAPGLRRPLLTQAALATAGAVVTEAALSFLGLGDPTWPSWGALVAEGARYLHEAPYLVWWPGAAMMAVTWALLSLGEAS